jgi:hypothetical protein
MRSGIRESTGLSLELRCAASCRAHRSASADDPCKCPHTSVFVPWPAPVCSRPSQAPDHSYGGVAFQRFTSRHLLGGARGGFNLPAGRPSHRPLPSAYQGGEAAARPGARSGWSLMFEADHRFRRVNGHLYLPKLPALSKHRSPRTQCRSQDEGQKRQRRHDPGQHHRPPADRHRRLGMERRRADQRTDSARAGSWN